MKHMKKIAAVALAAGLMLGVAGCTSEFDIMMGEDE